MSSAHHSESQSTTESTAAAPTGPPSPADTLTRMPTGPPSPADALMRRAIDLIDAGRAAGVTLRLTGGLAVRRYCSDRAFVEREHSDIDLMALSPQGRRLRRVLEEQGYVENSYVSQSTDGSQLQFVKAPVSAATGRPGLAEPARPRLPGAALPGLAHGDHIDVFMDVMRMDHDIDVRRRLEIDPYAVSPADILAVKLQIGEPAEKDIHDVVALLKDLPLSDRDDASSIHVMRLARLCARDWGLHHDVTRSLETSLAVLPDFTLDQRARETVVERIDVIQTAIDGAQKSIRWRLRARAGTRLPWRREVEEREIVEREGPEAAA